MSCTVNRWGSGTTCEKPRSTELAKEMNLRITAMNQERAKQDTIWNLSGSASSSLTLSATNGASTTNGASISNRASFKTCNS